MNNDYSESQYDQAITDVYSSLKVVEVDSLSLDKWMRNDGLAGDEVVFNQYMLLSNPDKKTNYYMIFTEFYKTALDSTYYNYKIRCETKNKKIWPSY
ncbi:MAG: hypothetical protein GYA51_02785 [Candidatus Methanofastidiosa archaeon]|nr:hypothetical protein [Candidatus Methanofastidiosa archaeon]